MIKGQKALLTPNYSFGISYELGGVSISQLPLLYPLMESNLVFNLTGSRFFTQTPKVDYRIVDYSRDFDFFVLLDTYLARLDYESVLKGLRPYMSEQILSFSNYTALATHVTKDILAAQGVAQVRRFIHMSYPGVQFDIQEMVNGPIYAKKQKLQEDPGFCEKMRSLYSGAELGTTASTPFVSPEAKKRNKILRTGMWMGALAQNL